MISGKKGFGTMETVGMLILAAIIIVALFIFITGVLKATTLGDDKNEQGFDQLALNIDELLDDPNDYASTTQTLFLDNDFMIAGFDKFYTSTEFVDSYCEGNSADRIAYKPTSCLGKSCICLYKRDGFDGGEADKNKDLKRQCHVFDGDITISSIYKAHEEDGYYSIGAQRTDGKPAIEGVTAKYERFLIHGGGYCDLGEQNPKSLYIEKVVTGEGADKSYNIVIVVDPNSEEVISRRPLLEARYNAE
jgi:hypothetical protein